MSMTGIIHEALTTDTPQVVLSRSEVETIDTAWETSMNAHISTSRPMSRMMLPLPYTEQAALSLYYRYIDIMGFHEICYLIEGAYDSLQEGLKHETLSELLRLLSSAEKKQEPLKLLSYYIREGCSLEELHRLGLGRNLIDIEDRYQFLAFIISAIILNPVGASFQRPEFRYSFLLTELENLAYLVPTQRKVLVKALRLLVDEVGVGFTLWLNIREGSDLQTAEIKQLLGGELLDVITHDLTE